VAQVFNGLDALSVTESLNQRRQITKKMTPSVHTQQRILHTMKP